MSNNLKTITNKVDEIGQHCLNLFSRLPKSGKPSDNEWTVLSCILVYDVSSEKYEVVSLGTGSKCIGAIKMSPLGNIMNDSHAEVFARRGFLLYLYNNIEKAVENRNSIFVMEDDRFKLKDNIEFIFYSSQLPCGDAAILPKSKGIDFGEVLESNKQQLNDTNEGEPESKKQKVAKDIHRTGAKCLPHCEQDLKTTGMEYHLLGQVRTKPGRGDRTLSVSCSDKIAKWVHLGIQGRLLNLFTDPIYVKHFIFGGGVAYSEESLKRAIMYRNLESPVLKGPIPQFYQTSVVFPHIKCENKKSAATSILWIKADDVIHEVAVLGRKLGVTKKKATLPSSFLSITKYNIYKKFQQVLHKNLKLKENICIDSNVPYNKMKLNAKVYEENWSLVKDIFFKTWTVKPDIWNFCVNVT